MNHNFKKHPLPLISLVLSSNNNKKLYSCLRTQNQAYLFWKKGVPLNRLFFLGGDLTFGTFSPTHAMFSQFEHFFFKPVLQFLTSLHNIDVKILRWVYTSIMIKNILNLLNNMAAIPQFKESVLLRCRPIHTYSCNSWLPAWFNPCNSLKLATGGCCSWFFHTKSSLFLKQYG